MSKFDYPSRYYADDKDVCDLLSEPKFNPKRLLRIARARGIFLSAELSKKTLIEYITRLPFSWSDLIQLIKSIETEEKDDDLTTGRITTADRPIDRSGRDKVRRGIDQTRVLRMRGFVLPPVGSSR